MTMKLLSPDVVFTRPEEIFYAICGALVHPLPDDSIEQPSNIREIVAGILLAVDSDGTISLDELLQALPTEYQPGQSNCTPRKLIPLIQALNALGSKIPTPLGWSIALGTILNDAVPTEVPPPADENGGSTDPWSRIRKHFPDAEQLFLWLARATNREISESLQTHWKKSSYSHVHPVSLMQQALSRWDGTTNVSRGEFTYTRRGFDTLMLNHVLPACAELLKTLDE